MCDARSGQVGGSAVMRPIRQQTFVVPMSSAATSPFLTLFDIVLFFIVFGFRFVSLRLLSLAGKVFDRFAHLADDQPVGDAQV